MHNKKQYNLLLFCKQFEVHVLQYIKVGPFANECILKTLLYSKMMYACSPAMNGLNINVHE